MKTVLQTLMCLCVPLALFGQSNVDRVTGTLDSLSRGMLDEWKYSTDFSGDPTAPAFNDAGWKTLKINESIYVDSCWLRREIRFPDRLLGEPIHGPVRVYVSVDDYGFLWVNGESKGRFPWEGASFEVTRDAKPGGTVLLTIKAINTGGPLRLMRAELLMESVQPLARSIQDFCLSLRVGQKLLSFDTYQTNATRKEDPGIDKSILDRGEKIRLNTVLQSLAATVDVDALKGGAISKFTASLDAVRAQLGPIRDFARRFTIFFDSNAHIDAAWLWRAAETIQVCRNTFGSVLNMMNKRPGFTYTQSSAAYYDWMQRLYPDLFDDIRRRVSDGRWEVVGGMWVEPDCNLPSGESWSRHLLYADRYFQKNLSTKVTIGWNPDSFGYNWNMPQFYRNAGIDAFITQKIGWNDTNVFPYRVFWWESPDGSKILSYFPFDYVNTIDDPFRLVDWSRQFEANTGFQKMMILFGVGDHGGGPSLEMLERIDHLQTLDVYPVIEYGTARQYIDWLKSQDLTRIPTWDDELYLEYHQGTFTTQGATKRRNRLSEVLLTNAEKVSTLAMLYGQPYRSADLEMAWRNVLFNQFHDILPGSGIRENYIDAADTYKEAAEIGTFALQSSLSTLAGRINTSAFKKGTPVLVFNTLAWDRDDLATVDLPEGDNNVYAVFDERGKEVPSQRVLKDMYHRQIIFIARGIPSMGHAVFELRKQEPSTPATTLHGSSHAFENGFFQLTLDDSTGWVRSIVDKRNGREILAAPGNELQLLEDKPSAWDAWNIGLTGVRFPSTYRGAEVVESGPVRMVVRLQRDYLKPGVKKDFPTEDFPNSFFTQDIVLYNGLDRIDFRTDVDWWEEKTMLKVAFPLAVSDTLASYEIPYGEIERSTQLRTSFERAKVEVPAERWADVSAAGYGVSLLNNSRYGYDIKGNVVRLSLLRSPKWPDPTADRGKHSIQYSLYPHSGSWREAKTVRRGYEFNIPLLTTLVKVHGGPLPSRHSFVTLAPDNLVLTSMKKAEDSDAWVIQWYDSRGKADTASLVFARPVKKAVLSDILENDGKELPREGTSVQVPSGRNAMVTVKVWF